MDIKRNEKTNNNIKLGDIFYYDEDEAYYLLVERPSFSLVNLDGETFYDSFKDIEDAKKLIAKHITDGHLEHLSRDEYILNLTRK